MANAAGGAADVLVRLMTPRLSGLRACELEMTLPVLIIGGGPVGLMAGDRGWRGVACMLVERGDGSIDRPKMDVVQTFSAPE